MNADELRSALAPVGIPERLIVVKDIAEYAWCVVEADGGVWQVSWMERGKERVAQ